MSHKRRITNYDEKDAFLYNHNKCPTKDYNDYRCPTKDELPIILRETLRPCAVFHLINENITFFFTQTIIILLTIIMMTIITRMAEMQLGSEVLMFGRKESNCKF